jgi:DnaK suppressor protein
MAVATKVRAAKSQKYAPYARLLEEKRDGLRTHLREHRLEVQAERIPEDNWGLASRELMQDLTVGTLEREQQLLEEVEHALVRLQNGVYGLCEGCGEAIPERRLKALPWARLCLACAERHPAFSRN